MWGGGGEKEWNIYSRENTSSKEQVSATGKATERQESVIRIKERHHLPHLYGIIECLFSDGTAISSLTTLGHSSP